jgi:hypothetical protein
MKNYDEIGEWLLAKSERKMKMESSYWIVSECLGKIALFSEQAAMKIIENGYSKIENRRLVVANSFRFCLESGPDADI